MTREKEFGEWKQGGVVMKGGNLLRELALSSTGCPSVLEVEGLISGFGMTKE